MAAKRGKAKAGKIGEKQLLLENFVLLQKTLVETAAALKEVNQKVTKLLDLFEEAGKKFREGKPVGSDINVRLETIEEQNRVIARSLLLLRKQLKEQQKYGLTKELSPSVLTRPRTKKRKPREEAEEGEEPLFKEDFGEETGETEESDEEDSGGKDEDYRPKPLPEFSF